MGYRYSFILLILLNMLYGMLMVGLVLKHQHVNDFMSLYSGVKAYLAHQIPYQEFHPLWDEHTLSLPYNLNPPIVFLIFLPFTLLPYTVSAVLWLISLILMGLASFYLSLSILFPSRTWRAHWPMLGLLYCMFGALLANEGFLQLGTLLALLVIAGYALLLRQRECAAGIIWGVAAAIKLFPALLLFYLISQKKWRGAATLLFTMLLLFALPLYLYPVSIYWDYVHLLKSVTWYGDSWNVSLYGYLHRVLSGRYHFIHGLFLMLSALSFIWYIKELFSESQAHYGFSLTLLMMLFLSPFGWYYYCTLLTFPLLMLSKRYMTHLWFLLGFFFLNLPVDYIAVRHMPQIFDKAVLYSIYFYGLLLFIYLISREKDKKQEVCERQILLASEGLPVALILLVCFMMRLLCASFIV